MNVPNVMTMKERVKATQTREVKLHVDLSKEDRMQEELLRTKYKRF